MHICIKEKNVLLVIEVHGNGSVHCPSLYKRGGELSAVSRIYKTHSYEGSWSREEKRSTYVSDIAGTGHATPDMSLMRT